VRAALATALLLLAWPARAGVLTLPEALARAHANPRVAQARASAQGAAAQIDEARGGWLPSASVTVGAWLGTANFSPQPGLSLRDEPPAGRPFDGTARAYYGAVAGLSQAIWDFGRTSSQVRAARASARAARSDTEVARADVELSVRLAYYDVLAGQELERAADEAVVTMTRHLNAAIVLVRVGKRPPFDVTRARLDLASARVNRLDAAAAVVQSRLALAATIGVDDLGNDTLEAPPAPAEDDATVEEVIARAFATRPDLMALEARLAAQGAVVAAQRSTFWPVLSVAGQVSVRGVERGQWSRAPNWQVGIQLSVPLLAGGVDLARLRQQEAALRALEAARDTVTLQARVEAQQLVSAVEAARARLEADEGIATSARENLSIAEERYSAGVATIIELADAEQSLTTAQAQESRARYTLATARARRDRAAGRGERRRSSGAGAPDR
jgi:outer membrane protein